MLLLVMIRLELELMDQKPKQEPHRRCATRTCSLFRVATVSTALSQQDSDGGGGG